MQGQLQHLETLVKKSFAGLYKRLQTIPSIGTKTALELIIVTDGFTRFEDVKALCAGSVALTKES